MRGIVLALSAEGGASDPGLRAWGRLGRCRCHPFCRPAPVPAWTCLSHRQGWDTGSPPPFLASPSWAHLGWGGAVVSGLPVVLLPLIPSNPLAPFFSLLVSHIICRFGFCFVLFFCGNPAEPGARQTARRLIPAKVLWDFGKRKGESKTERQAEAWAGLFAKAWPEAGRISGLESSAQRCSRREGIVALPSRLPGGTQAEAQLPEGCGF